MMQHLAAQKTEIASPMQVGKSAVGSEQQDSQRGRDFASMLEQSRAAERQSDSKVSNQNKVSNADNNQSNAVANDNQHNAANRQAEQSENVRKEERAAQTDSNETAKAENSEAADNNQASQEQASDSQNTAANDAEQGQAEQNDSGEIVSPEKDIVKEPAVHFDWLAMLDKLHGQDTAIESSESADLTGEEPHIIVDLQKTLSDLVNKTEGDSEEVALQTEINVDAPDDQPQDGETESETLSEILALLDTLNEEGEVSEEALIELDQMIDDFMTTNPNLENSPLKDLTGEDWLKLDAKLLTQILQVSNQESEKTTPVDVNVDEEFAKNMLKAEPATTQKVAEYLANNLIPKELNTPEARETFIDKLKSGVEEMKAQLKQGHEPGMDLGQIVKDALAAATEVAGSNNVDQAKLQQVLAAANSSMDMANQLAESKTANQDVPKVNNTSTKEVNTTQLEASRQQQANQIERTVNMNKPDAPQNLADKVQLMVSQKNMVAEIRLDPPDLGSMKVKVNMSGETASVNFVVQTQHAREALEQASPRLKELLDEQGIELGQSSVEQEARQQQDDADGASDQLAGGEEHASLESEDDFNEAQTVRVVNGSVNGIDYFA